MKTKSLPAIILSAMLTVAAIPLTQAAETEAAETTAARLLGDANNDGTVNINDVTAIQRHLAEQTLLTGDDFTAADITGDGDVSIDDVTILQRYLAEYSVDYPIGEPIESGGTTDPTDATEPTGTTQATEPTEATQATDPTEPEITGDEWKENTGVITLSNSGITVTGEGITVEGNTVIISEGGDWEVVGTCDDGMIYINTG